jgi:hypothetical protein
VVNKYIVTGALVALTGSGVMISAQAPATPSQGSPSSQAPKAAASDAGATTTLVGCVYQEKDVPGRAPNVAERAGILEDYILAEMPSSPAAGRTADSSTSRAPGAPPAAVGTSGKATSMYKLEFVDDSKLKSLVGKRVEVVGRIDAESGDKATPAPGTTTTTTDKVLGRDKVDLAEFEVSSIKEVAGSCPTAPTAQ